MKNEELINKWLLDKLSKDEEASFRKSAEHERVIKIWNGLPEVATPPYIDVERELERFRSTQNSGKNTREIKVSWHQMLIGIAASITLIAVLGYSFLLVIGDTETIAISESHAQRFLPDSSSVVLNKKSKLTYTTEDWSTHRSVHLEGEAFFEVKEGSAFDVLTADGMVTVVGTAFNVKQRDQFYEVICFSGSVKIETDRHHATLRAGEGFQQINGNAANFTIENKDRADWLTGKSSFYKTPYRVVLSEIENQYEVFIETKDVNLEKTFSGSFPNNNLKIALEAVTKPSSYHYKINGNKVLISRGVN
ncbi:MAG: FecR domain-containing protein [Cyclobacteriaceae bacterium]